MIKNILRSCIEEAQRRGQTGLLIWPSWNLWDNYAFELQQGNEYYDLALAQIAEGQETTITFDWNRLSIPGILAIPVEKLISSEKFFNDVLSICEKNHYKGPITLLPINEVSDYC